MARRKNDYAPHIAPEKAPPCHIPGCSDAGMYKAPKSKDQLHDYQWFCLEHIREHNQKWDFFDGLESDEIESFIKDAVTGHRPTWDRESRVGRVRQLQDALYEFMNMDRKAPQPQPPLSGQMRKALATMELEYPYSPSELKKRYRLMVKKYHPDMNKGNKQSEEQFKQITTAYHQLGEHLKG